ncbi:MAG TPA: homoserine kinase [Kiloniellales bacterium]|nr:homoserine kinase [Kiloniellales bacterium]
MAVYTEVSDDELRRFLDPYRLGRLLASKGIAEGVENSNFLLQTEDRSYILTLYEKRVRRDDLPFFLALMQHLSDRGISVPQPIHTATGEALRELCGRPAALFSFLEGLWPRRVHPWHCQALGETLAQLHGATTDFPGRRDNDLSLAGWRRLIDAVGERADEVAPGLAAELEQEYRDIAQHWPRGLPEGVIHADLFPDNVFFLDEQLSGLIDFYFACTDFYAYDLAICLNAWCFEPDRAFNLTKGRALLSGYQKVRPLTAAERAAMPVLARGGALRFLLTRLYDWLNHPPGAFVQPKDPREYLARLRFHRGVRGPEDYGLPLHATV